MRPVLLPLGLLVLVLVLLPVLRAMQAAAVLRRLLARNGRIHQAAPGEQVHAAPQHGMGGWW